MWLGLAVAIAGFLLLRLWPIWPRRFQGCDAYNILLCAEVVRKARRLPPRIPGLFILEESAQWYPPLFFALCAIIPPHWLRQNYWFYNQIVDLVNGILLFWLVQASGGDGLVACTVTLAYALLAGLVQEFAVLTTRPLGLLVLNLLLIFGYLASQDHRFLPLALASGVLLVYGHKLSAQQAWLSLPVLAAITGNWVWAALLPGMYAAAFLVWPMGFRQIVSGHIAIVRFWGRNWPLLGAHQVRQSPVYGDGQTNQEFYVAADAATPVGFFKDALHQNYFVFPALMALVGGSLSPLPLALSAWIASVYLAAIVTHFIPALRCLGLGRQYVKFAVVPSLLTAAIGCISGPSWPLAFVLALAGALTLRQYALVALAMRGQRPGLAATADLSSALDVLLMRLTADSSARIMALPVHLCDLIAYRTRRPVYWGTHAQIFDARLEAFFPLLRRDLSYYVADGALTHLILDTRYATAGELKLKPIDLIEQSGDYALYRLDSVSSREPITAG